jgi:hypothetical protein
MSDPDEALIEAPPLCAHHHEVVRNLAGKDHVGDADSERVANSIARQCQSCIQES